MIVAQIIRRTQLIDQSEADPFPILGYRHVSPSMRNAGVLNNGGTPVDGEQWRGLEEAEEARAQNKALLRLVYVLEKGRYMIQ